MDYFYILNESNLRPNAIPIAYVVLNSGKKPSELIVHREFFILFAWFPGL